MVFLSKFVDTFETVYPTFIIEDDTHHGNNV